MLQSLAQVENGLVAPKSFQRALSSSRVLNIDLSQRSIIRASHTAGITALDIDQVEDRYLLSGAKNGHITIHDLLNKCGHLSYTAEAVCRIRRGGVNNHKFCIKNVQWYPFDTGMFVTSAMDQKIKIWDANFLKPADSISVEHNISGHHISPLSTYALIAVAMMAPAVILIDPRTGARCHELRAHRTGVNSVRWSPHSEHLLATGGVDNKIFFWDIRSAKGYLQALDQHNGEAIGSQKDLITAHDGEVNSMRFTDDGLFMVSLGTDNRLRLWDVALCKNTLVNFGLLPTVNPRFQVSMDMCYFSKPAVLFVPCRNYIIMYELFTGTKLIALSGHLNTVTSCVFRSTTQELFSGGNDMNILLWTPDAKRELVEELPSSPCNHLLTVDISVVVDTDLWSGDES